MKGLALGTAQVLRCCKQRLRRLLGLNGSAFLGFSDMCQNWRCLPSIHRLPLTQYKKRSLILKCYISFSLTRGCSNVTMKGLALGTTQVLRCCKQRLRRLLGLNGGAFLGFSDMCQNWGCLPSIRRFPLMQNKKRSLILKCYISFSPARGCSNVTMKGLALGTAQVLRCCKQRLPRLLGLNGGAFQGFSDMCQNWGCLPGICRFSLLQNNKRPWNLNVHPNIIQP